MSFSELLSLCIFTVALLVSTGVPAQGVEGSPTTETETEGELVDATPTAPTEAKPAPEKREVDEVQAIEADEAKDIAPFAPHAQRSDANAPRHFLGGEKPVASRARRRGLSALATFALSALFVGGATGFVIPAWGSSGATAAGFGSVAGAFILANSLVTPFVTKLVAGRLGGKGSYASAMLGGFVGRVLGLLFFVAGVALDSDALLITGFVAIPVLGLVGTGVGYELWHARKSKKAIVAGPGSIALRF